MESELAQEYKMGARFRRMFNNSFNSSLTMSNFQEQIAALNAQIALLSKSAEQAEKDERKAEKDARRKRRQEKKAEKEKRQKEKEARKKEKRKETESEVEVESRPDEEVLAELRRRTSEVVEAVTAEVREGAGVARVIRAQCAEDRRAESERSPEMVEVTAEESRAEHELPVGFCYFAWYIFCACIWSFFYI